MASRSDIVTRARKIIEVVEALRVSGKTISSLGIPMRQVGNRFNPVLEMFESGSFKSLTIQLHSGDEVRLSISRRNSGTLRQTEYALEQIESMLAGEQFDVLSKDKTVQAVQLRFITEARELLDALEERVKQGHDCAGHGQKLIDDLDQLRRQRWLA